MNSIFAQLALILSLSSVLGFITYRFKLPLLIAYLTGGLLLSAIALIDVTKTSAFSFLPDIGIAFVLFLVGMELDLREIKSFGRQILISGVLQVIITSVLGTFIAQSFNFKLPEALYLGIGLSFSSTIVVVKLMIDKKELTSLHGKLSLGVLLLEDLLAVLILLAMTSSVSLGFNVSDALPLTVFVVKVFLLFALALLLSHFVLPQIFKAVSDSPELLFLTALAWCFAFITIAQMAGFSILIGAFLAGIALASSPYHFQIQGKVKPLRDFFTTLFFVYLGTRVNFADLRQVYPLILIFSAYAVLVKPIIYLLIFGIFGFRKHTLFHTAINLSQISEFSLIILLIGLKMNIVSQSALTVIALSSVLSIIGSSLIISRSRQIYKKISFLISFFERESKYYKDAEVEKLENHVVLIGSHQVGEEIVKFLQKERIYYIVLDFNPLQVERLSQAKVPVIFGDMGDPEVLDLLNLSTSKIVISTVPDLHASKLLIEDVKEIGNIPVIVRADSVKEAKQLYKAGADFVYIPDLVSGHILVDMLEGHLGDKEYFKKRPEIELEKLSKKTLAWE